jgi:hypothetical protein
MDSVIDFNISGGWVMSDNTTVTKRLLDIDGAFRRGFVFGFENRKSLRKIFGSRHTRREIIRLYLTDVLDAIEVRIFRIDDRCIGVRERL